MLQCDGVLGHALDATTRYLILDIAVGSAATGSGSLNAPSLSVTLRHQAKNLDPASDP